MRAKSSKRKGGKELVGKTLSARAIFILRVMKKPPLHRAISCKQELFDLTLLTLSLF
jgi:hypothetical protein